MSHHIWFSIVCVAELGLHDHIIHVYLCNFLSLQCTFKSFSFPQKTIVINNTKISQRAITIDMKASPLLGRRGEAQSSERSQLSLHSNFLKSVLRNHILAKQVTAVEQAKPVLVLHSNNALSIAAW